MILSYRIKRFLAKTRRRARLKRCQTKGHDWYCVREMDSMMSPLFNIDNMPLRCFCCKARALTDWRPGNGGDTNVRIIHERKDYPPVLPVWK
jgi:hypothetical protein